MKNHFHWNEAKETKRGLAKRETKIKKVFIIHFENKQNQTAYPKNTHIQSNTSFRVDLLDSAKVTKQQQIFSSKGQVHESSPPSPFLLLKT